MQPLDATGPFETLQFRRNPIIATGDEGYRVYKNPKEFVVVEATNASDAFAKSGLPRAHRIERDVIRLTNVFHLSLLDGAKAAIAANAEDSAPPAAAPAAEAEVKVAESAETPVSPPPPTDQALSNDEVNRLLQG